MGRLTMVHFLVEDTGPSWITPLSNLTSKLTKPTAGKVSHVAVKQAELQRVKLHLYTNIIRFV